MGHTHPKFVSWAAQDGRVEDLVYHLQLAGKNSLNFSAREREKRAPIHLAAIGGHTSCVKVLFEAGSSLEVKDGEGHTPLHLAVCNQHYRTAQLLLSLGANPNSTTRFLVTPLHQATSLGNTPCVELLLSHGALINCKESWGQTPLSIATLKGRLVTMQSLLRHGADPEICDYQHEQTSLHIACASRDEARVLVLLDAGCNLQATNKQEQTPLGVAIMNKCYRTVPLLLEYGAGLSDRERDSTGVPLLQYLDDWRPLSLSRLCRVVLRRTLGPSKLLNSDLNSLGVAPHLVTYLQSVLEVCEESEEVKRRVVEGVTVVRPMIPEK